MVERLEEEGLEEEGLEEEPERAPLVIPSATPGGPPVVLPPATPRGVLPRGVVRTPVPPAPVVKEVESDDLSDLFDVGAEEDLSDLFSVSTEDVLGGTEEGLADLVEVSEEDIMGKGGADMPDKEATGYDYLPPKRKREAAPRLPRTAKVPPETSMGGLQE